MDKDNRSLLNFGLGFGILSMFFSGVYIIPIFALIISYAALMKYDFKSNRDQWKGVVGLCLGIVYFIVFLYVRSEGMDYSNDTSNIVFWRQVILFIVIVSAFGYNVFIKFRESKDYDSHSQADDLSAYPSLKDFDLDKYMYKNNYKSSIELTNSYSIDEITHLIKELGKLLDIGLLTQEEFDSKKRELLNRL